MMDAIWELQRAVYVAMTSDADLQALIGDPARVFDAPPDGVASPYVVIGATRAERYRGVDDGLEHDLRLYVHSRYAGRREIKDILGALYDALHEAPLDLNGQRHVRIRFIFGDVLRRQDGDVFHGVARFRAVTQKI